MFPLGYSPGTRATLATGGLLGELVPVADPGAMLKALGDMTVRIENAKGEVLAEAQDDVVLGNPVQQRPVPDLRGHRVEAR